MVFCIFLVGAIICLVIKNKVNKGYYYKFYKDRLEYKNTLFSKKSKELKYEDFKEIRYNQGYIQSKFNLGELLILTNNKNFFKRVFIFKSIPDIKDNYEKITKIFNN